MFQSNQNLRRKAGNPIPKAGSDDKVQNYGEGARDGRPCPPEPAGEADKVEVSARISQTSNGGDSRPPPPELSTSGTKETEKEIILVPRQIATQQEKDLVDIKLLDVEDMIERIIRAVDEGPEYFAEAAQPEPEHLGADVLGQEPQASTTWNDEPTVRFAEERPTDISAEGAAKKGPRKPKAAKPALKHRESPNAGKKSPVNDKMRFFGKKKPSRNKVEKPIKQRTLEATLAKYPGSDSSDFLAKLSFLDNIDRKITWGKAKAYPGSVTVSELNDDGTGTSRANRLATKIRKRKKPPPQQQPKPKFEGMSLLRSILGISTPSPNTKRRGAILNAKEAKQKTSGRRQGRRSPGQPPCGKRASSESKGDTSPGTTSPGAETKDAKKEEASSESEKSTTRTESDTSEDNNTSRPR